MLRIVALLFFATLAACADLKCQKGASWSEHACNKNCSQFFFGYTHCTDDAAPGCECDDGLFLTNAGECVRMFKCPEEEVRCPPNQAYSFCKSCPKTCEDMYRSPYCLLECQDDCQCVDGYLKNHADECVKPHQCKAEEIICPAGLKPRCGNGIITTCENFANQTAAKASECIQTCACAESEVDKVYDPATKQCILQTECKGLAYRKCKKSCLLKLCTEDRCYEECDSKCVAV